MTRRTVMWFRRDLRLADLPALHAAAAEGGDYPPPMVDHGVERAEALARYRSVTAGSR